MPAIQNAYDNYREREFIVLAVDVREDRKKVAKFGNANGLSFNLLLDSDGGVARQYLVKGFPTSFFVHRSGVISAIEVGMMSKNEVDWFVNKISQ